MAENDKKIFTRRDFLQALAPVLSVPPAVLAACGDPTPRRSSPAGGTMSNASTSDAPRLYPTPACDDGDDVTPPQTEGPFYTPDSPERRSFLEPGIEGTKLVVTGRVLTTACAPVAGALLDFWHADDRGVYDNAGYKLRGHQFTDDEGRYRLETIIPGLYPGRTRHIHVKVQAPQQRVLTTQLYFPGEPLNRRDGIFHPALVMDVREGAEGQSASFDFVVEVKG